MSLELEHSGTNRTYSYLSVLNCPGASFEASPWAGVKVGSIVPLGGDTFDLLLPLLAANFSTA